MKRVVLFTDGSCLGNPGPGGWACVLRCGTAEKELSGAEADTTNNRMELQAVIAGLSALKEPCAARVVTDSQYVQRAMTEYLRGWVARGWVNSRGVPVANRDLWEALLRESSRHRSRGAGFVATDRVRSRTDATNLRRLPRGVW